MQYPLPYGDTLTYPTDGTADSTSCRVRPLPLPILPPLERRQAPSAARSRWADTVTSDDASDADLARALNAPCSRDITIVCGTSLVCLKRLGLFSGSWVTLRFKPTQRCCLAFLVALSVDDYVAALRASLRFCGSDFDDDNDNEAEEDDEKAEKPNKPNVAAEALDIFLPPALLHRLRVPPPGVDRENGDFSSGGGCAAASGTDGAQPHHHQLLLSVRALLPSRIPTAPLLPRVRSMTVKRVHGHGSSGDASYSAALSAYFGAMPRILGPGDVFGVPLASRGGGQLVILAPIATTATQQMLRKTASRLGFQTVGVGAAAAW